MSPSDRERAQVALDHLRAAEVEVEAARQALADAEGAGAECYARLLALADSVRAEERALLEMLA